MMEPQPSVSFDNTEIAFKHKTNKELKKARLLFKSFSYRILLTWGPGLANIAVSLGLKGIIKNTIFAQFCGGEDIRECKNAIEVLGKSGIGTILDYSVEGEEEESVFITTCEEIIKTIETAAGNPLIPFSVFKVTGIIPFTLLEKVSAGQTLTSDEQLIWDKGCSRFEAICFKAAEKRVRLFVDAEESWIQDAIDHLTESAMEKYNRQEAIIYNTIQLYRADRLQYLEETIQKSTCYLGFKLVRGAYMEKERKRALDMNYPSPIQPDKAASDRDYNRALEVCLDNVAKVSICCGTHNEESSLLLTQLMEKHKVAHNDKRIYFSQLLGMSDNISFNLAASGYNVAKYVPYGPVKAVIPYLTRRASENSSVKGQAGRELALITRELTRRKAM